MILDEKDLTMASSDSISDGTLSDLSNGDDQFPLGPPHGDQVDVPLKNTKFADILARRRNFSISNSLQNTG